jgi:hypothetical protein
MMEQAGDVYAGVSRHSGRVSQDFIFFNNVPFTM